MVVSGMLIFVPHISRNSYYKSHYPCFLGLKIYFEHCAQPFSGSAPAPPTWYPALVVVL